MTNNINFKCFFSTVVLNLNEIILKDKVFSYDSVNFFKYSIFFKLNTLIDIICVDYVDCKKRFKLVYILQSYFYKNKISISFSFRFLNKICSFVNFFKSSVWLERENFDMFGLNFFNNPDLRKILTDYTFFGHPLKKDFPLSGYFELSFSEKNFLIQEKVCELMQEYRFFQTSSSLEEWDLFNLNFNK